MKANAKTEAAVMAVLDKFLQSYKKRDLKGLMSLLAPDDDLFMYGTGIDEKRIGKEQFEFQAKRDWSQSDELAFNLTWHKISSAGTVAWIAADGFGQGKMGGHEVQFPVRMTAVLEQRGNDWFLTQSHISLPAPNQDEGDSMPV